MNLAEFSMSDESGSESNVSVKSLALEMRQFLELGAVQLEAAIKESDGRVNALAMAVTAVATDARALQAEAHQFAEGREGAAAARERIIALADSLSAHVRLAITSLQFYDKLVQRLTHVRDGLVIPADSKDASGSRDKEWDGLLEQVRGRYSMVEERVLFDFMMRGLSADQMLKGLTGLQKSTPGDLELF